MWTCPKCGRVFKRTGQSHYCGESPKTVDEYIEGQVERVKPLLKELRRILRESMPDAVEVIRWSMPCYLYKGVHVVQFSVGKSHIALHVGEDVVAMFTSELAGYMYSRGTLRLPFDSLTPDDLIARMAAAAFGMVDGGGE